MNRNLLTLQCGDDAVDVRKFIRWRVVEKPLAIGVFPAYEIHAYYNLRESLVCAAYDDRDTARAVYRGLMTALYWGDDIPAFSWRPEGGDNGTPV